ncbi:MAG: penicillin-binding transpeptidase domain-containing protein, partial [Bacteroidales bacterium]|nr:penicillin-binding transpeptidase domain-containing protein [Bacteroidales bacterium]
DDPGWNKVTLPMLSIGYGILLTPLHTLTFYNAIANGGRMFKPYLIDNIQKNGEIIKQFQPVQISGAICSKSTIEAVHKALRGVVLHGTAKTYNDSSYLISGKTGTAQMALGSRGYIDAQGYRKHQASFAGFFPSDNPVYSIIVVLYTNKTRENFYGGTWAAPVFKEIADKIYSSSPEWKKPLSGKGSIPSDNPVILSGRGDNLSVLLSVMPSATQFPVKGGAWVTMQKDSTGVNLQEIRFPADTVPDVMGMGLRDALYLLENMGYTVRFQGAGKVTSQNFSPAVSTISRGVINLKLSESYETE